MKSQKAVHATSAIGTGQLRAEVRTTTAFSNPTPYSTQLAVTFEATPEVVMAVAHLALKAPESRTQIDTRALVRPVAVLAPTPFRHWGINE